METTSELSLQDIMTALEAEYTGKLPVVAMRAAQQRREEITPFLIDAIRKATEAVRGEGKLAGDAHLFALFLLTEFRCREALPAILEAVSLPEEGPFELFGDAITEDLSSILAELAADTPAIVDELLANRSVNTYVRWEAAQTYLHWVRDERLSREKAVQRLREHLQNAVAERNIDMVSGLVAELTSYSPREARAEIEDAFHRGLVDISLIDLKFVEESIAEGESRFQKELQNCRPTGVSDAIDELSGWYAFQEPRDIRDDESSESDDTWFKDDDGDTDWEEEHPSVEFGTIRHTDPRVGRNDPCPCGSGKKFKKCCGAR